MGFKEKDDLTVAGDFISSVWQDNRFLNSNELLYDDWDLIYKFIQLNESELSARVSVGIYTKGRNIQK